MALCGLKAVMWTDTAQSIIMLIGGTIMCIMSFKRIGGYQQLEPKFMQAIPSVLPNNSRFYNDSELNVCGLPRPDSFSLYRSAINGDIPWPGIFGILANSIWYWCADQIIVQRTLAAKNLTHAKLGCIFAALCKISPMFLMVMVGMISRIDDPDTIACATETTCMLACGNPSGCSNIAYPRLIGKVLPVGLRGLMLAVMLSALMSSLTSIFNSAATLFSCDIYGQFMVSRGRKQPSESELVWVGRVFIVVLIGISIAWVPIIQSSNNGQL